MNFEYHEPRSLAETTALLQQHGGDSALLAGGTALLVDMRHGERQPGHLISLWGIPGLEQVRVNGGLHIGAVTTITDLAASVGGDPALRGLQEAAWLLGSRTIQNVATVGGNICKASPGADMVPPLLCLDALLHLSGPNGDRTVPLDGFLTGPDLTAIGPAEVLVSIDVESLPPRTGTAFFKTMRRHATDCSIVAVAASVQLSPDGNKFERARVAIGASAPVPFRAKRAEELLTGAPVEGEVVREAARQARDESRPISDVRASADYRRTLVETLTERAILKAVERARQGGEAR